MGRESQPASATRAFAVAVLSASLCAGVAACSGGGGGAGGGGGGPQQPGSPLPPGNEGPIVAGVYLQNVGPTQATIAHAEGRTVTTQLLTGLTPDTEYGYEARDASGAVVR